MDAYKINNVGEIISKPPQLYHDIENDNIPDKRFHMYRNIDIQTYDEIFCISDIHADVYRFWIFLHRQGFVTAPLFTGPEVMIWNPEMKNKTIVICGDLIDGRRMDRDNQHSESCNEVSLHWIIYNLRLDAIKHNSYIFCTLGNHDFYAFHGTKMNMPFMYSPYIDSRSKLYYTRYFDMVFSDATATEINKIYLMRTYILSRFYLIGFPFFLKINQTLFAHAGFHPSKEVLTIFESGKNSSSKLQPLMMHRMMLKELSDSEEIEDFMDMDILEISYPLRYNQIFAETIDRLHGRFNRALVDQYSRYFTDTSDGSPASSFFLTRELQRNCPKVEQILAEYDCNMIVVGHCPTCLGTDIFQETNVDGILPNCSNAKIVYSCNSQLVTVDIASSSAFSPEKDFIECLWIKKTSRFGNYSVKTIRYCLKEADRCTKDGDIVEYNDRTFNVLEGTWDV